MQRKTSRRIVALIHRFLSLTRCSASRQLRLCTQSTSKLLCNSSSLSVKLVLRCQCRERLRCPLALFVVPSGADERHLDGVAIGATDHQFESCRIIVVGLSISLEVLPQIIFSVIEHPLSDAGVLSLDLHLGCTVLE
jgi:hypothetical protein